jgi:hypothetical protein
VRHDLVFDQLAVALGRLRADRAGGLPLVDPGPDMLGHCEFRGLDIGSGIERAQELGELALRVPLCAFYRVVADRALACCWIAPGFEFQFP